VLRHRFAALGLAPEQIARCFLSYNAAAPEFLEAGKSSVGNDE
jgi:hypothetical protein